MFSLFTIRRLNIFFIIILLIVLTQISATNHLIAYSNTVSKIARGVTIFKMRSNLLSEFWKRPIIMKTALILPPHYSSTDKLYPVVYHIHGFGADYTEAYEVARETRKIMREQPELELIHIFLNAAFDTGHHGFVNSSNNGPWSSCLIEELIPTLEKTFRIIPQPEARFLMGHSSGGWSAIWLKVQYPKKFAGVWATSPDPLDFENFFGVDLRPGSKDNMYHNQNGKTHLAYRNERDTIEDEVHVDDGDNPVEAEYSSDEWRWSPKDENGLPKKVFDRETGVLNQEVLQSWQAFDLKYLLEQKGEEASPLINNLHIVCGLEDSFFLEKPTQLFCAFIKNKWGTNNCEFIPQRKHADLYLPYKTYPQGLAVRFYREMIDQFSSANVK